MSVDRSNREDYYFEAEDLLSVYSVLNVSLTTLLVCSLISGTFKERAAEGTFATPLRLTRARSREA